MTLFDYTKLRIIQESETDWDSPGSEELHTQYRENIESLLHLGYFADSSGTVKTAATSSAVSKCTIVKCTGGASWSDDDHNSRTLLFINGNAAGNYYTIDDSSGTTPTLHLDGDNLVSDGVAAADSFKIFYNLQSTAGHTHDGVDAAEVDLPTGRAGIGNIWSLTTFYTDGAPPSIRSSQSSSAGTIFCHYRTTKAAELKTMMSHVYIPNNANKIYIRTQWNALTGGKIRYGVYDGASTVFGSSSSGAVVSRWTQYDGTIDVSTMVGGWAEITARTRPDDTGDVCRIRFAALCWGT